jgi:superfamily II DNA/RNA helicase
LMREVDVKNAIIFCNRKKDVGVVCRSLQRHGFSVGALHGDMDQRQRMATLEAFRNGTIAFLAASDVAARGLDIPAVSHIFNYDVPVHPEDYVHRIGRTGRAGREGFAAMLVTPKDFKALKAIEKMLRQEIPWVDGAPSPEEIERQSEASERSNGRRRRGGRSRRGTQKSASAPRDERPAPHSEAPKPHKAADGNGRRPKARDDQKDAGRERKQDQAAQDRPKRSDSPHGKPQGMGDHVPAFMMRPVRVP